MVPHKSKGYQFKPLLIFSQTLFPIEVHHENERVKHKKEKHLEKPNDLDAYQQCRNKTKLYSLLDSGEKRVKVMKLPFIKTLKTTYNPINYWVTRFKKALLD